MGNVSTSLDDIKLMYLIRRFEEKVEDLFATGDIFGTTHLCIGQEAVPVGVSSLLTPKDLTVSNHRGHGHFLARGADPARLFAELMGRIDGYCKGKGGTQHLSCLELGHLGSNGITGGGLAVGTGAALAQKQLGTGAVVVIYFGDGAIGEGIWHESLNIASLWKLPVLFVCENNLYAMSTPVSAGIAGRALAPKAASYDISWTIVDGNDPYAVREAATQFLPHVRACEGPAFIEAQTYRYRGHSKSDAREYRTREEENTWAQKDPILRERQRLEALGVPSEAIAGALSEIDSDIADAVEFAKESPFPPFGEALSDIFA